MPSEPDADPRCLEDILHHVELANRFVGGMDFDDFRASDLHLYAVTRCLEIISEASRRLSLDLKSRRPTIAWREMAAAGNVYRHEYEDVAAIRVWRTLTGSLPPLREAVIEELRFRGNE